MFIALSGFLFLLIIVILIIASSKYGYEIFSKLDSDAKLQEINKDSQKFRIGTQLVVLEHIVIISLAVSLFIAFSPYNLILGIIWVVARGGEGLIQIYNKTKYWGLLNLAEQYSDTSGDEKSAIADSALGILKSKNSVVSFAQILFSIGTLAYSILFVVYGVVPVLIGWFGIIASIIYGLGNGVAHVKSDFMALWNLGGLLIWIFELILGGWLLITPFLLP
ncbi:MAG: DUF4386 domain-containing protein [Candidatus Thorarchaeota archaeon]